MNAQQERTVGNQEPPWSNNHVGGALSDAKKYLKGDFQNAGAQGDLKTREMGVRQFI